MPNSNTSCFDLLNNTIGFDNVYSAYFPAVSDITVDCKTVCVVILVSSRLYWWVNYSNVMFQSITVMKFATFLLPTTAQFILLVCYTTDLHTVAAIDSLLLLHF